MISFVTIFFFSHIYFQIFLYKYNRFSHFHMIPAAIFLIVSFFSFLKLIIFTACSLKDLQNFSIQSLLLIIFYYFLFFLLYTSCLFSVLVNEDIVDIEKPDGICLLTFVADEFSGLFLHPSIFPIIHPKSA